MKSGIPVFSTENGTFLMMIFKDGQEPNAAEDVLWFRKQLSESPADMIRIAHVFHLPAFESLGQPSRLLPERCQRHPATTSDHSVLSLRRPAPPQVPIEDRAAVAATDAAKPNGARHSRIYQDEAYHFYEHLRTHPPSRSVSEFIDHHFNPLPVTRQSQPEDSHPKTIP